MNSINGGIRLASATLAATCKPRDYSSAPNTTTDDADRVLKTGNAKQLWPMLTPIIDQIGKQFTDDGCKLKPVARKPAGDGNIDVRGVAINHEMAIRRQRVNAHGCSEPRAIAPGRC